MQVAVWMVQDIHFGYLSFRFSILNGVQSMEGRGADSDGTTSEKWFRNCVHWFTELNFLHSLHILSRRDKFERKFFSSTILFIESMAKMKLNRHQPPHLNSLKWRESEPEKKARVECKYIFGQPNASLCTSGRVRRMSGAYSTG